MNTETDTRTRRMHVKINVEIGMMHLQVKGAKDCQPTPEVRREASNHFSLAALRRNQPCEHLDLRFLIPRSVRQYMSVFKVISH